MEHESVRKLNIFQALFLQEINRHDKKFIATLLIQIYVQLMMVKHFGIIYPSDLNHMLNFAPSVELG